MRRTAYCLILTIAPVSVAWADDALTHSQRGACVYSSDALPPARVAPASSRAATASVRTAPARAGAAAPAGSGGGGSDEDLIERMRAPRWHSFLPGMFR